MTNCQYVRLFGVLACIAAISGQSAAQQRRDADKDREAVIQLENDWLTAEEGDRSAYERILADDFVHPVPQGIFLGKRQQIEWAVKHPRPASRKARFSRMDVRLFGDAAIVNGVVENSDLSGADLRRTIFADVFAWRNGRWQAVNAQENPILKNGG